MWFFIVGFPYAAMLRVAVAVSGDGRTVAAATAERLYIIRGGKTAAELDAPMVRSIALSWDGLATLMWACRGLSWST